MASFRIALVRPITVPPADEEANVAAAVEWIAPGGGAGAPISSASRRPPGPWCPPAPYDPAPAIVGAAAKHNVHAVFSTIEPIDPPRPPPPI